MRYGLAYLGTHLPDTLERELDSIRADGFDEVVLSCQENDFMHLTGKVENAPRIARKAGLTLLVNLWGYAAAFGGGRISRLVADYPETMVVGPDGRPRYIEWPKGNRIQPGCPNHPKVVERAREFCRKAADAGAHGFFWDEPTKFDCWCGACRALFRDKKGKAMEEGNEDELAWFRRHSVARWVEEMSRFVKGLDGKLVTSTCVMPSDRDAWTDAAACPSLDSLGTDPYWMLEGKPVASVTEPSRALVAEARKAGKSPHLWLQCWDIRKGRETELVEASRLLAAEDPDTLYVWAWRGQEGTTERCDEPAAAWKRALEGFRAAGMKARGG